MAAPRYLRRPDVSETDVDGEIFLVEPGSQDVFYLDAVGAGLWRLLDTPQTLVEAKTVFAAAFPDAPAKTLSGDLEVALDALVKRGLVTLEG